MPNHFRVPSPFSSPRASRPFLTNTPPELRLALEGFSCDLLRDLTDQLVRLQHLTGCLCVCRLLSFLFSQRTYLAQHHATASPAPQVAHDVLSFRDNPLRKLLRRRPATCPALPCTTSRIRRWRNNRGCQWQEETETKTAAARAHNQGWNRAIRRPDAVRPRRSGRKDREARMPCPKARRKGRRAPGLQESG